MGVNRKGKRKIILNDRVFYWCVEVDIEDGGIVKLYIILEDKKFIVRYSVGQSKRGKQPFIEIQGKEFEGLNDVGKVLQRVITPRWDDEIITPGLVREIIEWCFSPKNEVTFVDWQGNIINS